MTATRRQPVIADAGLSLRAEGVVDPDVKSEAGRSHKKLREYGGYISTL